MFKAKDEVDHAECDTNMSIQWWIVGFDETLLNIVDS